MARGGYRVGGGRKPGTTKAEGLPTKVVGVSTELPNECYQHLPELLARIDDWEERIMAANVRGESLRTYEKLAKLIEEIRSASLRLASLRSTSSRLALISKALVKLA